MNVDRESCGFDFESEVLLHRGAGVRKVARYAWIDEISNFQDCGACATTIRVAKRKSINALLRMSHIHRAAGFGGRLRQPSLAGQLKETRANHNPDDLEHQPREIRAR